MASDAAKVLYIAVAAITGCQLHDTKCNLHSTSVLMRSVQWQVLLSLGVSYTNELDQRRALSYLHTWLANHAKHGPKIANMQHPEDTSQKLSWVISLFETAAASAPADADVQVRMINNPERHA